MAVLFYAPCFTMQFVCTLPKAPVLTAVSDAERFDSKNFLRTPAWQKAVSCQRVKYDMKCF